MSTRKRSNSRSSGLSHVVLAGLGNIGSQAADLIARLGIPRMTLVDAGSYESKNIKGQAIDASAIGRPKAMVIAERLRRINRALDVRPIHARLQDIPLGVMRGADVLACGLDSRLARACANQAARQLGIPTLIDAGVEASQLLIRVNVHRWKDNDSCLQCGWSDNDYNLLEVRNPCQAGEDFTPATNAPAALGALAASFLALELKKLLDGDFQNVTTGKQITYCALTHRLFVTSIGRNEQCRCDHKSWSIKPLKRSARQLTLGEAIRGGKSISVPGKIFVRALVCTECGSRRALLQLAGRLTARQIVCLRCRSEMVAPGFDQFDRLNTDVLGKNSPWLRKPLSALGIVDGDILGLRAGDKIRHVEVGCGTNDREVNHA